MTDRAKDKFSEQILKAGLALIFCAAMGAALLQAAYRILAPWELRAYWHSQWCRSILCLPLVASVHLFGRNALAIRTPLLLALALALSGVLWLSYRALRSRISAEVVLLVVSVCLVAFSVQQWISMSKMRAERHEFFAVRNYLVRCAAPGELLVVDKAAFELQMDWYAPESLQDGLAGLTPDPALLPKVAVFHVADQASEFVFVGDERRAVALNLAPRGFVFNRDSAISSAIEDALKRTSGDPEAEVYFVAPGAAASEGAVSSRP